MSKTYKELSAVVVTVTSRDECGAAETPTTARYRIDDCRSGRQLVSWTSLTPSLSMQISIPGSVNAIINSTLATPEVKTITLEIDKDLVTQQYASYTYGVKNLNFAQVA